jgi:phage-related minor tail protein
VKKELNLVKKDLQKINKSIEDVEKQLNSPKNVKNRLRSKKKFDSLVLPEIKDPKQERIKRLAKMLQVKQ